MTRVMVVWCPDWPVTAAALGAGVPAHQPVAVLSANRVLACSPAARAEGVRRGLRRREAQGRCPGLTLIDHDPARDAREFEPVVIALEEMVAGVQIVRPGVCALAVRGPARFFGSEELAAERIVEHLGQSCAIETQVGIAEGVFAARLAARAGRVVPSGQTPAFLAELDIATIGRPDLVDLLRRLGIGTLGAFAALPAADVLARFGVDALAAHRMAGGNDARALAVRRPPPDLVVTRDFDEPLDRIDTAAFAARQLAIQTSARLAGVGLACTRLGITAITERGEELHRVWRHDGLLTPEGIADRLRWQLDGWLSGARRGQAGPTAGIRRLTLAPEGVMAHVGLQPGLWGELGERGDRASRAFTRVQGLLGPETVVTAVLGGGRDPGERVRLVPWGDEIAPPGEGPPGARTTGTSRTTSTARAPSTSRITSTTHAASAGHIGRPEVAPWPGRLPAPAPATVHTRPLPVEVSGRDGAPIGVSARLAVTGEPAWLTPVGQPAGTGERIIGWAGPWPVEERWWAPEEASRRARFQVVLDSGRALLLTLSGGHWAITGEYD